MHVPTIIFYLRNVCNNSGVGEGGAGGGGGGGGGHCPPLLDMIAP